MLQGQKRCRSFVQQQNHELNLLIYDPGNSLDFREVLGAVRKGLEQTRANAGMKWVTSITVRAKEPLLCWCFRASPAWRHLIYSILFLPREKHQLLIKLVFLQFSDPKSDDFWKELSAVNHQAKSQGNTCERQRGRHRPQVPLCPRGLAVNSLCSDFHSRALKTTTVKTLHTPSISPKSRLRVQDVSAADGLRAGAEPWSRSALKMLNYFPKP